MCDALEAVHEKNIVHLDLKPENVYLVPLRGGRTLVKLLDFGIAKFFEADVSPELEATRATSSPGTPDYMSPEQAEGKRVNQRSDVYSLGVMAFEMFLQRRPFLGDSRGALLVDHIQKLPPRPASLWPEIPPSLDTLLTALLEKNPARRPELSTVRAVLVELRDAALQVRTENRTPVRSKAAAPPVAPAKSHRRVVAAIVLSMTALLGGVGWSQLEHFVPPMSSVAVEAAVLVASPPPASPTPEEPLLPLSGTLGVTVNVAAARFLLDGRLVSENVPSIRVALQDDDSHTLVVTAHGYRDYQRQISVEPGRTEELVVELSPVGRPHPATAATDPDYIIDSLGRSR